jgi:hypothetical protein
MKLAIVCSIPLIGACFIVGDEPGNGDEHKDPPDPPITGMITADTTWSGMKSFSGNTVIVRNISVTVAPGTTLLFEEGAKITVDGALRMDGTQAQKIIVKNVDGATKWGPFSVGGELVLNYADMTGGAIESTSFGASITIQDSKMWRTDHDYIVLNGGSLSMIYSQVGAMDGETDTTHCQLHVNAGSSVSVMRSNINGAPFGLMFYGGTDMNFQYNNWYGNGIDIDAMAGVSGNFSFGWFEKGAPTPPSGTSLLFENLAAQKVAAGPR